MSFKLSLGLAGVLVISVAINIILLTKLDKAKIELQTAISNQVILERTIQEQNEQIKKALADAKKTAEQIQSLNTRYNESQAQVTKLRNKFAKFNLEGMALTDPLTLQGKINRATARVGDDLTNITNSNQFDENTNTNNNTVN
tara:strand:+ start:268 stop:696 length:429 start_codon:yes stop_codon:yes gene_type:complete